MIVYISGPITGIEDENRTAFSSAAEYLRSLGHEPINPHEVLPSNPNLDWHDYITDDILAMRRAEAIAFLPGWEDSYGALIESIVAVKMGLTEISIPSNHAREQCGDMTK